MAARTLDTDKMLNSFVLEHSGKFVWEHWCTPVLEHSDTPAWAPADTPAWEPWCKIVLEPEDEKCFLKIIFDKSD